MARPGAVFVFQGNLLSCGIRTYGMLGQLHVSRPGRQLRGQDLLGLGRKLGGGDEQRGLAVVEDILELWDGECGRQRHGYCARGQNGEESDCKSGAKIISARFAHISSPRRSTGPLTYVIVAVLYQKRNPLAVQVVTIGPPPRLQQPVPRPAHVAKQPAVGEAPARERVDHGEGVGVVAGYGFEDGQARQGGRSRRRHPHLSGCCG